MANVLGNRPKKAENVATPKPELNSSTKSDPILIADANKRVSKKAKVQEKFKKAERSLTQPTNPVTRSNKRVVYFKNNLDLRRERKRDVHGTTLTIPLYVEEFRLLEALYELKGDAYDASSITDFLRGVLIEKAKNVLTKKEFDEIYNEKLNQKTLPNE